MDRKNKIKEHLGESYDIVYRSINIDDKNVFITFLSSLGSASLLASLVEGIVISVSRMNDVYCYPSGVVLEDNFNKAMNAVLSGQCVMIIEGVEGYFVIETRSYPSRASGEPRSEQSVRASQDGFVENIIFNTGLIRRRVRDSRLSIKLIQKGLRSKTDIAYAYIQGCVDEEILIDFQDRIDNMEDADIISERYFVDLLYGKSYNPYSHVKYTQRSDIASICLLQGYIVVIVDNSCNAVIIPTTFFEQLQQIEEYTQTPVISMFIKIIRMIGILFSIYLLPFWVGINVDKIPTFLNIPLIENLKIFEFGFQVLFADIVVEWIRLSLIHTPSILSGILGFIAVFILGDMAIELGAYTKEVLVVIALVNIGTMITPNYELSLANKIFRIMITILALCFGCTGFIIGCLIHFFVLVNTKHIGYPYLYPIIPFSYQGIKDKFFHSKIRSRKHNTKNNK